MSGEIRMFSAKLPCSQSTALPVQTLQRQFNKNCFLRKAASSPNPNLLQWMPRCFIYVQWKHSVVLLQKEIIQNQQQLFSKISCLCVVWLIYLCFLVVQIYFITPYFCTALTRGLTFCCLVEHRQNCSLNLGLRLSRVTCGNQKKFSRCVIVNGSRTGALYFIRHITHLNHKMHFNL